MRGFDAGGAHLFVVEVEDLGGGEDGLAQEPLQIVLLAEIWNLIRKMS